MISSVRLLLSQVTENQIARMVVDDKVVIEVKSIEQIAPVHKKQLLTYLRLMDKRLGLLINFNVALIKNGIVRVVNGLQD